MSFDPNNINFKACHFVSGKFTEEDDGKIDYIRPSDQKNIIQIPNASEKLVDETVQKAKKAFKDSSWSSLTPRDRAKLLFKWADLIEADVDELSKIESMNSTRMITETSAGDVFAPQIL